MSDDVATLGRLLAARHSCRAFLPDPVAHATIESILRLAQRTASWCNAQPWQVIVTEGTATEKFRSAMMGKGGEGGDFDFPQGYPGLHGERRREVGHQLYDAVGVARGDRVASARQAHRNFEFFGAPHVAIVTTEAALGTYGAIDTGGYVANFLLAATAHGVATVAQAALAFRAPMIRAHFGLPEERRIICGISFGFADGDHPANSFRAGRAPLDQVARFVGD